MLVLHLETKNTPKNASQILVKDKARFDLRNTPGMIFPINELENLAGYGFVNVVTPEILT